MFTLLGALLMFTLEPLVGRLLLAGYGGSFQVWTTCLMFFQGLLLLGYLYAHWVAPRIGRGHIVVAAAPLLVLPLGIAAQPNLDAPITSVLAAIALPVGLPFLVLSTTAVLAQQWLAQSGSDGHDDPYHLYAASNGGSLIGLLAYPLVLEPLFGVSAHATSWSLFYLLYLGMVALLALPRARPIPTAAAAVDGADATISPRLALYWLLLSAAPAVLLMAVTNRIAAEIGSLPVFWVLPLALYLGSFVIVFARKPWERNRGAIVILSVLLLGATTLLPGGWFRLGWYLFVLFGLCVLGHGELHATRPAASRLTLFYLILSLGGFLGGAFVGLAAPVLFTKLHEYPLGIALLLGTLAFGRRVQLQALMARVTRPLYRRVLLAVLSGVAAMAVATSGVLPARGDSYTFRNFYGLYFVLDGPPRGMKVSDPDDDTRFRYFVHGQTLHGVQMQGPDAGRSRVGYFQESAPYGDVMAVLGSPKKAGVIGLGAGNMSAYFEAGDELVFYELDRDNERIARDHFAFLEECPAELRVVIGDGRVMLAADPNATPGYYDAVVIDAFSGDGIPVHLLTREAIGMYRSKVRDDGLLVFHISNRYFDLKPVLRAAAESFGLHSVYRRSQNPDEMGEYEFASIFYAMSDNPASLEPLIERGWEKVDANSDVPVMQPWTDDHVNVMLPLWSKLRGG